MFAAMVCAILSVSLEIAPAVFIALLAGALSAGDFDWAWLLVAGMVAASGAAILFNTSATIFSHSVAIDVQAQLRLLIGKKLLSAPLGEIEKIEPSEIRHILLDDIDRIEDGIAHLIPDLAAALVAPIMICVGMFVVDWQLAFIAIAPTLLGFAAFSLTMSRGRELGSRFIEAQADMANSLQEIVAMMPVIKSYNRKQKALLRSQKAFDVFRIIVKEWVTRNAVSSNVFTIATTSSLIAVLPVGLWLYSIGDVSIPVLVFFCLGGFALTSIGSRLFGAMGRLRVQKVSMERIQSILVLPDFLYLPSPAAHVETDNVEFSGVAFSRNKNFALSEINLCFPSGSKVAIVGPSGSGKSTLAELLLRLHDPERGAIRIGGVDLRSFSPQELSRTISAVFQDVFLFTRSIGDNIRIGRPDATDAEVAEAARLAQADKFIRELAQGYDTTLTAGMPLSSGQRQRICIARAILINPSILVLDEATAYADPESEHEIQKALSELTRGRMVIMIAHRLSTIQHFDSIIFLKNGRVAEQGTHDELLVLGGEYARQWHSHMAARNFQLPAAGAVS
ncbi:ABC transporter ATP-binding protein [Phyllobacterium sp. SB3]|uniref:ABC transporter ATP-binding protein n=1 Tax=Phyllobacterium sp. SB3 TaxID=3156073 RepID=UPI0032AEA212